MLGDDSQAPKAFLQLRNNGGRVAKLKYWWRSLVMQRVVIAGEKVLAFAGDFRG